MQITFLGHHRSDRRWHPKVSRGAASKLSEILKDTNPTEEFEFWSEFDISEATTVRLTEKIEGNEVFWVVTFAAANWVSVSDGILDAVSQLAAALLLRLGPGASPLLPSALQNSGVVAFDAKKERLSLSGDTRIHFTIATMDDLLTDSFFAIANGLDRHLSKTGIGEVTGTGWGIGGWSLDVACTNDTVCMKAVADFLKSNGISGFKRL